MRPALSAVYKLLTVHLIIRGLVCLYVCMNACMPICLHVHFSIFLSVCLSVFLCVYLSVCLAGWLAGQHAILLENIHTIITWLFLNRWLLRCFSELALKSELREPCSWVSWNLQPSVHVHVYVYV